MGAFKKFLSSDLIVTPFEVNKSFSFTGAAAFTGSDVGIDRFLGKNILNDFFTSGSNPQTGEIQRLDQELVYNSTKQLYYTNYQSSSFGDEPTLPFVVPGLDETGDVRIGSASSAGRFENYLQTTLRTEHYFPTESNAIIGVISIPTKLYGERIQPGTFTIAAESGSITDDGNGGLYVNSNYVGNIIYQHGVAILTQNQPASGSGAVYGTGSYGTASYGDTAGDPIIENIITSSNVTCSFSSSYTLFETQYKCTVDSNEFSFTLNPTVISGSTDGTVYDFATGSYFDPYVTTVGLYNEAQDLIAVAKLGKPLPLNSTTDTNIIINIDR